MYDDRKTNRSRIPLVDSLSNNSGGWLRHKEKMSFREYISVTISVAVLIIFSITLGYKAAPEIESIMNKIQNNYGDSPEECTNLSLRDTAYCLNNYVSSIYKYEVTQDRTKLSTRRIKRKRHNKSLNCRSLMRINRRRKFPKTQRKYRHTLNGSSSNKSRAKK